MLRRMEVPRSSGPKEKPSISCLRSRNIRFNVAEFPNMGTPSLSNYVERDDIITQRSSINFTLTFQFISTTYFRDHPPENAAQYLRFNFTTFTISRFRL
ncbi:hypothetical protein V6N13_105650 [Hibiscus sabdariffa]